jgi:hypothetical protein
MVEIPRGDKIGSTVHTVARQQSHEREVDPRISVNDIDVTTDQSVIVYIGRYTRNGKTEELGAYQASVYNSRKSVTLRKNFIQEHGIDPGEKLLVTLYEKEDITTTVSDIDKLNRQAEATNTNEELTELVEEMHSMISDLHEYVEDDD